ncbi:MAG TPA: SpoIIE family protein phosphatase [Chthoniobacter sp.]|jgi:sigma-B regulation protein RsbU (phosphoserine phosphatase)
MGNRHTDASTETPAQRPPVILLADDEPAARRLLSVTLERLGFEVREAADGEEALEIAMNDGPDLMVLDFEMPRLTGAEVCHLLRTSERTDLQSLPVIMLTAHAGEAEEIRCLQAGANDYVTKPVSRDILAARIHTQLRLRCMANELLMRNAELAQWRGEHEADIAAAHAAQQVFIPHTSPAVPGWSVQSIYQPIMEIGGDVFGWQPARDGRWFFWLADATGHGAAAALFTALAAQLFRQACDTHEDPASILGAVNREFHKGFDGRAFMSACCARVDPHGDLAFCGAGHPPLFVRRKNGAVEALGPHGTVVGIKPDSEYQQCQTQLLDGDAALLYSDGLFAFKDPSQVRFTHETLAQILPAAAPGNQFIDQVLTRLREASNGDPGEDDIAAIALTKGR